MYGLCEDYEIKQKQTDLKPRQSQWWRMATLYLVKK